MYMLRCYCFSSSHPLLPLLCPQAHSLCLILKKSPRGPNCHMHKKQALFQLISNQTRWINQPELEPFTSSKTHLLFTKALDPNGFVFVFSCYAFPTFESWAVLSWNHQQLVIKKESWLLWMISVSIHRILLWLILCHFFGYLDTPRNQNTRIPFPFSY